MYVRTYVRTDIFTGFIRWSLSRWPKKELEQQRREEDLNIQEKDDRTKNDNAALAKKYGDAIRGSIIPMGPDPLDAPIF